MMHQRQHIFPNGAVATIRPVSQFTLASLELAVARRWPRPAPPLAPGVNGELEPNAADPDYHTTVETWQAEHQIRVLDAMLDLAVDLEVDTAALARVRATFERMGLTMDEISDKVAYIKHCCVTNIARDLAPLAAIMRDEIPTEDDVHAHVALFRRDVETHAH